VDEDRGNADGSGCCEMREVDTLFVNGTAYLLNPMTRDQVAKDVFEMNDELFLQRHAGSLMKLHVDQS
jgi:hypothetical protein